MKRNIGINAILNVVRQSLSVIFPLITYPYALRVLGAESVGKVNYGFSVISYFSLIAMLGVSTYAVREGAKIRDDKEKFNRFVTEVFSINLLSTLIAYILLAVVLIFINKFYEYRLLLLLQSMTILFTTLGVDWINTIFEDFFVITIRTIFTYIVSIVLLFTLVHSPKDYYIYAAITVVTTGLVCFVNLLYCRKYVKLRITKRIHLETHIRPMLILFANALAVSVYVNVDTTMLGWIKGDYYVGQYSAAVKIYSIIKSMLAAIYVVFIPRLSFLNNEKQFEKYQDYCSKLWGYLSLLLIPASAGIILLSKEIIYIIGGETYLPSVGALRILSIALIFAIFGGLISACMNITLGREKITLQATVISAIINVLLNIVFIKYMAHYGAAITTAISEFFVFIFCFCRLPEKRRYIDFIKFRRNLLDSQIGTILIAGVVVFVRLLHLNTIITVILSIIISALFYCVFLLWVRNPDIIYLKKIIMKRSGRA